MIGILKPFIPQLCASQLEISGVLSGDFIDVAAEVLFTVRIVRGESEEIDSSIPKFDLNFPWPENDRLDVNL